MSTIERDYDKTVLSLRLTSPEAVRFWTIMDAVKAHNPYVGKSDVVRELLGLAPLQALSKADIKYFQTGEREVAKTGLKGIPIPPRSSHPIPVGNKKLEGTGRRKSRGG